MKAALLFLISATIALAAPRTWTSADGRHMEAEYLGRSTDGSGLVLRRADTQARVTVPLAALSTEDQAHAATLTTTPAPAEAPAATAPAKTGPSPALLALAKAWPEPKFSSAAQPYWSAAHTDFTELQRTLRRDMDAILSGDVGMNCRSLRTRAERELTRLRSEGNPSGSAATKNLPRIGAAQLGAHWLSTCVLPHITKIETEATKTTGTIASSGK
jgi:hypothetical protein